VAEQTVQTNERVAAIRKRLEAATVGVFIEPEDATDGDRWTILPVTRDRLAEDAPPLTRADLKMLGNAPADIAYLLDQLAAIEALVGDQRSNLVEEKRDMPTAELVAAVIAELREENAKAWGYASDEEAVGARERADRDAEIARLRGLLTGWPEKLETAARWLDLLDGALELLALSDTPEARAQWMQANYGCGGTHDEIQRDVREFATAIKAALGQQGAAGPDAAAQPDDEDDAAEAQGQDAEIARLTGILRELYSAQAAHEEADTALLRAMFDIESAADAESGPYEEADAAKGAAGKRLEKAWAAVSKELGETPGEGSDGG